MRTKKVGITPAGLAVDALIVLAIAGVIFASAVPRERYFDIRGANMVGIAATYYSAVRRGYSIRVEVEGAWHAGGMFRASGKVLYADSKRLILYDDEKGVLVLSDEFDEAYVDGVPKRVLIKLERSSGVERIDFSFSHGALEDLESIREICEHHPLPGLKGCFISASFGIWLYDANVTVPASLIEDLAASFDGITEVRTAGYEAVIWVRFMELDSALSLLEKLTSTLDSEGIPYKGILVGPYELTLLFDGLPDHEAAEVVTEFAARDAERWIIHREG